MKKLALLIATGTLVAGCSAAQPDDPITEQNEQAVTYNCSTDSGKLPTKAALAAAMASELGRWDIYNDLYVDSNGMVALTSTGKSRCAGGVCPRTDAILGLQDAAINEPTGPIKKSVFDATSFKEDLKASFERQKTAIQDALNQEYCPVLSSGGCYFTAGFPEPLGSGLKAEVNGLKNAWCMKTPEDHKMVFKSSSSVGPCGAKYNMYTYTVQKPGGGNLCNVNNLQLALAFFGWANNPNNPNGYIAFSSVDNTVTIDPTDTDVTTPSNSGSCVVYDYDRVSDPNSTLLGTCCTTQANEQGSLVKLGRGMLGCKAGVAQTTNEPCTPTATATATGTFQFNTTAAYCLKVTVPIAGWGVSNFDNRTLSVNSTPVTSMGSMPLPALYNGAEYFWASGGSTALSYAAIYFW